jgi:hypothetical protein
MKPLPIPPVPDGAPANKQVMKLAMMLPLEHIVSRFDDVAIQAKFERWYLECPDSEKAESALTFIMKQRPEKTDFLNGLRVKRASGAARIPQQMDQQPPQAAAAPVFLTQKLFMTGASASSAAAAAQAPMS